MPKDQGLTTRARARGKNSQKLRQTTPNLKTADQPESLQRTTTSPPLHKPSRQDSELSGEGERPGRRLHRAGLFEPEPEVQDLLEAWDAAEPFTMLDDQEAMARVLIAAYPGVDLVGESRKIIAWWFANPSKRKTKRGVKRFLNAWFSRASTPGGPRLPHASRKRAVSYDASDLWGDDEDAKR